MDYDIYVFCMSKLKFLTLVLLEVMYVMVCTRPDLAYDVSVVSHYEHA